MVESGRVWVWAVVLRLAARRDLLGEAAVLARFQRAGKLDTPPSIRVADASDFLEGADQLKSRLEIQLARKNTAEKSGLSHHRQPQVIGRQVDGWHDCMALVCLLPMAAGPLRSFRTHS